MENPGELISPMKSLLPAFKTENHVKPPDPSELPMPNAELLNKGTSILIFFLLPFILCDFLIYRTRRFMILDVIFLKYFSSFACQNIDVCALISVFKICIFIKVKTYDKIIILRAQNELF